MRKLLVALLIFGHGLEVMVMNCLGYWQGNGHTETKICEFCGREYSYWVSDAKFSATADIILTGGQGITYCNSIDDAVKYAKNEIKVNEYPEDNMKVNQIAIIHKDLCLCMIAI